MKTIIAPALAATAAVFFGAAAQGVTLLETFDGDTVASQSLTLANRDAGGTTFSIVNQAAGDDALLISQSGGGGDVAFAAATDATPFASFVVSADLIANNFNFTNGNVGLFALGGDPLAGPSTGNDQGYNLILRNLNNNSSTFSLQLRDDETLLAESAANFDVTTGPNGSSDPFSLSLTGTRQANGDLTLTGTFTPTAASLTPITLTGTVAAAAVENKSSLFGVRQGSISNNLLAVQYDNVRVDVAAVPEPTTAAVLVGLGGLTLARRRRA